MEGILEPSGGAKSPCPAIRPGSGAGPANGPTPPGPAWPAPPMASCWWKTMLGEGTRFLSFAFGPIACEATV